MIIMRYNNSLEIEVIEIDTYFTDNEKPLATLVVCPPIQDPYTYKYFKSIMFIDKESRRQTIIGDMFELTPNTDDIGHVKQHFNELIKHPLMKAAKRTVELDKFNF